MTYRTLTALLFTLVTSIEAGIYLATNSAQYAVLMGVTVALAAVVTYAAPADKASRFAYTSTGLALVLCMGLLMMFTGTSLLMIAGITLIGLVLVVSAIGVFK